MKFIIQRNKWRNSSHGKGVTSLLNKEGYQCCLGFCAEQMGVSRKRLTNKSSPYDIFRYDKGFDPQHILVSGKEYIPGSVCTDVHTDLAIRAIRINDSNAYDLQLKEQMLIRLFEEYGHELEFVGDYEVGT